MSATLQMTSIRRSGRAGMARLNRALVDALHASGPNCETCRDIEREVDSGPEGGEYVEASGFPGTTVQKLDAHFKFHWKDDYQFSVL